MERAARCAARHPRLDRGAKNKTAPDEETAITMCPQPKTGAHKRNGRKRAQRPAGESRRTPMGTWC
ncbi:MAG: hypothetical protein KA099_04070 [Alphaproteobacteria bacterium]|nr:hypothetical protein [Alphaproteobacteria bacterium]MBP7904484.1 hypothetical protein [Alphaproteobacteria bacterium]